MHTRHSWSSRGFGTSFFFGFGGFGRGASPSAVGAGGGAFFLGLGGRATGASPSAGFASAEADSCFVWNDCFVRMFTRNGHFVARMEARYGSLVRMRRKVANSLVKAHNTKTNKEAYWSVNTEHAKMLTGWSNIQNNAHNTRLTLWWSKHKAWV